MAEEKAQPAGPDLTKGVAESELKDGKLLGHVGEDDVLVVRTGDGLLAVDAHCTHYHGPLAEGLVDGHTVRCPWHHACFDLRTGEAVRAPALSPLACWNVEQRDGRIFVCEKQAPAKPATLTAKDAPKTIVIVGCGAAGFAAAEMLRRHGFGGSITLLSDDDAPPVDRPNLSKDYLAGSAPEDWLPLKPDDFYTDCHIDLRLKAEVIGIDIKARQVMVDGMPNVGYDRLLLATGAEPVRLPIPGADQDHVHTLRTLRDSRAIVSAAKNARRAVVIGASFIGLEAAASLRSRNVEVHVVAPEVKPMVRVLGAEMGDFVRKLHEQHGVVFHLENSVTEIGRDRVVLKGGGTLKADLVVVGVGVRPRLTLAENAGLEMDRGVTVNAYLETSTAGVYAAGDIARWPDPYLKEKIRVEHWVVAERQGQTAARNMLGMNEVFDAVPFFWSQHYDVPINYVGHAEQWDETKIEGSIESKDCVVRYERGGKILAVASIFRDVESLQAELAMERLAEK
jgi:NADPH-dependent 2,4-dienoyl-CoA reductase/sulfur reductase-like enzyme/nitrite reductase/ring-hydroxylating ferredoxin subunit